MNKQLLLTLLAGGIAATTTAAYAQANDALLNKLVAKGILTKQEADELKTESDAGLDKSYHAKTGLPEWVTSLKFSGDVRGRYDWIDFMNRDADQPNIDRHRFQVRARVGLTATFKDQLELGFRLTSAESDGSSSSSLSQGGNPISGNSTFQNNGSKKFAFIDLAYGKWTPIKNDDWLLSASVGKIENPFTFSDLVMDGDYTPEGGAVQLGYNLNKQHSFKLAGSVYVLDEVNQGDNPSADPTLIGAQASWNAKWTKVVESTFGLAAFSISDTKHLGNSAVPNINVGNSRDANGLLENNYNPLVADAGFTYWLEKAPIYKGRFPLRAFGTVVHNPSADDENTGWEVGFALGKAGRKGTWELNYRYRHLEADAMYEEFPDSDFGAFYAAGLTGSGKGAGYGAGTNVKGHTITASYSPADAFTVSVSYSLSELIDALPSNSKSETGRMLLDAMWKF
jgi:hypothetical protein